MYEVRRVSKALGPAVCKVAELDICNDPGLEDIEKADGGWLCFAPTSKHLQLSFQFLFKSSFKNSSQTLITERADCSVPLTGGDHGAPRALLWAVGSWSLILRAADHFKKNQEAAPLSPRPFSLGPDRNRWHPASNFDSGISTQEASRVYWEQLSRCLYWEEIVP